MVYVDYIEEKHLEELAVLYEALSKMPSNIDKMKQTFNIMSKDPNYHLLGAFTKNDNKLIGTLVGLVCRILAMDCNPVMFMEMMVVSDEWKGKGVGKKLLIRLEEISKHKECFFIQFCSSMFRKEAHGFYEAMGYKNDVVKGYRKYLTDLIMSE